MIDYYNNETRLTEILRAVVNSSTIDLGPARTREEIFVSRAFGLTMWPAIPPRTTMEMWLAFIAGDTAEPAAGTYTVRTCAESCIITYARRVRGASAVVPIFVPHTHYERALAKLAGIVPLNWGVLGREWEHLLQTITVSTMPRSAVSVIGGERVGIGPGGEITPFQDLHGYSSPWPGGVGKNLFDPTNVVQGSINGDNGVPFVASTRLRNNNFIPLKQGTYTISANDGFNISGYVYGTDGSYIKSESYRDWSASNQITITLVGDRKVLFIFRKADNSAIVPSDLTTPMLELGSTATAFEPYENLCPIYPGLTLVRDDETTLVVWGGTPDAATGKLTVDRAMVDLGTLTWKYTGPAGHERMYTTGLETVIAKPASQSTIANIICSGFVADSANSTYKHSIDGAIAVSSIDGEMYVYWSNMGTDVDAFKTAMSGVQLVYELATPVTYQLTRAEVQRALNCAEYLGAGVWRLNCAGATIIHARIRTENPTNHYDLAASNEDWSFTVTVDSTTVSGDSGIVSVAAGDHDVVIVATPGEGAGVCFIHPTLYYTAVAELLGSRQDLEETVEPEEPAEPEEPEPEEPAEPEPEEPEPEEPAEPEPVEPEPEEPEEPEPEEPVEPEPEEPAEPEPEEPAEPEPEEPAEPEPEEPEPEEPAEPEPVEPEPEEPAEPEEPQEPKEPKEPVEPEEPQTTKRRRTK